MFAPATATLINLCSSTSLHKGFLVTGPEGAGKSTLATLYSNNERYQVDWLDGGSISQQDIHAVGHAVKDYARKRLIVLDDVHVVTRELQENIFTFLESSRSTSWLITCGLDECL